MDLQLDPNKMFRRAEDPPPQANHRHLRRHLGHDFVSDDEEADTGPKTMLLQCDSLPSLIRSGIRASTTDHHEQSIREYVPTALGAMRELPMQSQTFP